MRIQPVFPVALLAVLLTLNGCGEPATEPQPQIEPAAGTIQEPVAAGEEETRMTIEQEPFGDSPDGEAVTMYTLKNANGVTAKLIDYGAILYALEVPDRNGNFADIVLGCDSVESYAADSPYFGATVGRYANRIAGGRFTINGEEYGLAINNHPNHLHGGEVGFDKVMWDAEPVEGDGEVGVRFHYLSEDMEEGYPGNLDVTVVYYLTNANELRIGYEATTDKPTPVNLTHHSYFNLKGHDQGDILDHMLTIQAGRYTPADETFIPTGAIEPVSGTPFDFVQPTKMGARIDQVEGGYDLNYVLNNDDGDLALAARVVEPTTGRVMEIYTTEPGLQFYTGNFLDGSFEGKDGAVYQKHGGFCLEAQKFPDTPNKPDFPSATLQPGQTYRQTTTHAFSVN